MASAQNRRRDAARLPASWRWATHHRGRVHGLREAEPVCPPEGSPVLHMSLKEVLQRFPKVVPFPAALLTAARTIM